MARFDNAIGQLLKHEGGYVNHPADPGGETNFGISKRSYPSVDIKNLTVETATEIYRHDYWQPIYGGIESQDIAAKIFDLGVNMGTCAAHRILQRALCTIGHTVAVDGLFGPHTLTAVNAVYQDTMMVSIRAEATMYYLGLGKMEFLNGWLRRLYGL